MCQPGRPWRSHDTLAGPPHLPPPRTPALAPRGTRALREREVGPAPNAPLPPLASQRPRPVSLPEVPSARPGADANPRPSSGPSGLLSQGPPGVGQARGRSASGRRASEAGQQSNPPAAAGQTEPRAGGAPAQRPARIRGLVTQDGAVPRCFSEVLGPRPVPTTPPPPSGALTLPHGHGQDGSPGLEAFHRAKSLGDRFSLKRSAETLRSPADTGRGHGAAGRASPLEPAPGAAGHSFRLSSAYQHGGARPAAHGPGFGAAQCQRLRGASHELRSHRREGRQPRASLPPHTLGPHCGN